MRWGVISDIHANLPALEAAVEALEQEQVDGFLCPGDVVGYGPHPNEAVALVRALDPVCVAGNHDLMALGRLPTDSADALARTTLEWTSQQLNEAARTYLAGLPRIATAGGVALAHGSLDDPTEYVREEAAAAAALATLRSRVPAADLLVLGHTHQPAAYGELSGVLRQDRRRTVRPPSGERWLLNAGSVGQPREWRRVVRFAVVDITRREAVFHAVRYDHRRTTRDLVAVDLPARAAHRRPRFRSAAKLALSERRPRSRH